MASILDTVQGGFAMISSKLADVASDVPAAWKSQLAAFKVKANTFASLYSDLQKMSGIAAKNPALAAQYNSVMTEGNIIQRTTMDLLSKIGQGLSVMRGDSLSGGLGFLPLIPIAAVTGVTYTLGRWIDNAYAMKTKLATVDQAIKAGASPDAIAREASKPLPMDTTITSDVKDILKYGLIAAGLYLAFPYIKKAIGGKR